MNKIVHLSLTNKSVPTRFDVVQYSTKPAITFVIDDYIPYGTANLYIKKPDGTEIYNVCTISGNEVTYQPTTQSFAAEGINKGQLHIVEPDGTAVSFLMFINVTENIIDSDAVESQDEFTALEAALQTVGDLSELETRMDQAETDISAIESEYLSLAGGTLTGDLSINDKVLLTADGSIACTGADIALNADLNSYTTPGIFACRQNATVASLSHCPTEQAFRMEVTSVTNSLVGANYIVQRITDYFSNVYIRNGVKSGNTWTWYGWRALSNRKGVTLAWNDTYISNDRGGMTIIRDNVLYLQVWFKTAQAIPQGTTILTINGMGANSNLSRGYFPVLTNTGVAGQVQALPNDNKISTNYALTHNNEYKFINGAIPLNEL